MSKFSQYSLGTKLLLFLLLAIINYMLFPTAAIAVLLPFTGIDRLQDMASGKIAVEGDKYILLFIQAVASLGTFAFTALLLGQMETGHPFSRLKLNIKAPLKILALTVFAILIAQGFVDFLVEMNRKIPVPDMLKPLVEAGKQQEKIVDALFAGNSVPHFLAITIVFAIIPAVGEEFFFRGLFLGELLREKVSPALAISITGFLFALAHLQFENFIAIWILGAFLGYLFYTTGSLWVPIAAHFTNNFLAVFFKYLYNTGWIKSDIAEASMPAYAVAASMIIFSGCIFLFNKWKVQPDFEETSFNELTEP